MGQSDNVVFRLRAQPAPGPNQVAGPFLWPAASSISFPFRVRGSQARVLSGTATACLSSPGLSSAPKSGGWGLALRGFTGPGF